MKVWVEGIYQVGVVLGRLLLVMCWVKCDCILFLWLNISIGVCVSVCVVMFLVKWCLWNFGVQVVVQWMLFSVWIWQFCIGLFSVVIVFSIVFWCSSFMVWFWFFICRFRVVLVVCVNWQVVCGNQVFKLLWFIVIGMLVWGRFLLVRFIWCSVLCLSRVVCLVSCISSCFLVVVVVGVLCLISRWLIWFFSVLICCEMVEGVIFSDCVVWLKLFLWIIVVRVCSWV